MANKFNVEDYIKDLAPELQEKARQCKNMDELMELAGEEGVELSDEALANVSGGCGSSSSCKHKGYNGVVYSADRVSNDGVNSVWKITMARCTMCQAVISAQKEYKITVPNDWSIYTQTIYMNDILN